jgi:uncharacterized protein YbjT (DUF2867 family)
MKIVVIGGTGLIGSKLVEKLAARGHDAVPASPKSGVDTLTGEGLAEALAGAQAVVDVSNSPSFADEDVLRFFRTSTGNLLQAEREAGVQHHVALSVVGTELMRAGGYMRAKYEQEQLIKASGVPYSIVHATQFFEFAPAIADTATEGDTVRLPAAPVQPIAAEEVAGQLCLVTIAEPINGAIDIAGPETMGLDEFVRRDLAASGDPRTVVSDPSSSYFGMTLDGLHLVPRGDAVVTATTFAAWLEASSAHSAARAAR